MEEEEWSVDAPLPVGGPASASTTAANISSTNGSTSTNNRTPAPLSRGAASLLGQLGLLPPSPAATSALPPQSPRASPPPPQRRATPNRPGLPRPHGGNTVIASPAPADGARRLSQLLNTSTTSSRASSVQFASNTPLHSSLGAANRHHGQLSTRDLSQQFHNTTSNTSGGSVQFASMSPSPPGVFSLGNGARRGPSSSAGPGGPGGGPFSVRSRASSRGNSVDPETSSSVQFVADDGNYVHLSAASSARHHYTPISVSASAARSTTRTPASTTQGEHGVTGGRGGVGIGVTPLRFSSRDAGSPTPNAIHVQPALVRIVPTAELSHSGSHAAAIYTHDRRGQERPGSSARGGVASSPNDGTLSGRLAETVTFRAGSATGTARTAMNVTDSTEGTARPLGAATREAAAEAAREAYLRALTPRRRAELERRAQRAREQAAYFDNLYARGIERLAVKEKWATYERLKGALRRADIEECTFAPNLLLYSANFAGTHDAASEEDEGNHDEGDPFASQGGHRGPTKRAAPTEHRDWDATTKLAASLSATPAHQLRAPGPRRSRSASPIRSRPIELSPEHRYQAEMYRRLLWRGGKVATAQRDEVAPCTFSPLTTRVANLQELPVKERLREKARLRRGSSAAEGRSAGDAASSTTTSDDVNQSVFDNLFNRATSRAAWATAISNPIVSASAATRPRVSRPSSAGPAGRASQRRPLLLPRYATHMVVQPPQDDAMEFARDDDGGDRGGVGDDAGGCDSDADYGSFGVHTSPDSTAPELVAVARVIETLEREVGQRGPHPKRVTNAELAAVVDHLTAPSPTVAGIPGGRLGFRPAILPSNDVAAVTTSVLQQRGVPLEGRALRREVRRSHSAVVASGASLRRRGESASAPQQQPAGVVASHGSSPLNVNQPLPMFAAAVGSGLPPTGHPSRALVPSPSRPLRSPRRGAAGEGEASAPPTTLPASPFRPRLSAESQVLSRAGRAAAIRILWLRLYAAHRFPPETTLHPTRRGSSPKGKATAATTAAAQTATSSDAVARRVAASGLSPHDLEQEAATATLTLAEVAAAAEAAMPREAWARDIVDSVAAHLAAASAARGARIQDPARLLQLRVEFRSFAGAIEHSVRRTGPKDFLRPMAFASNALIAAGNGSGRSPTQRATSQRRSHSELHRQTLARAFDLLSVDAPAALLSEDSDVASGLLTRDQEHWTQERLRLNQRQRAARAREEIEAAATAELTFRPQLTSSTQRLGHERRMRQLQLRGDLDTVMDKLASARLGLSAGQVGQDSEDYPFSASHTTSPAHHVDPAATSDDDERHKSGAAATNTLRRTAPAASAATPNRRLEYAATEVTGLSPSPGRVGDGAAESVRSEDESDAVEALVQDALLRLGVPAVHDSYVAAASRDGVGNSATAGEASRSEIDRHAPAHASSAPSRPMEPAHASSARRPHHQQAPAMGGGTGSSAQLVSDSFQYEVARRSPNPVDLALLGQQLMRNRLRSGQTK